MVGQKSGRRKSGGYSAYSKEREREEWKIIEE